MSITKTDGLTSVVAGNQLTYTITAANAGPSDAVGAMIADTIPIELVSLNLVSCTPVGVGAACDPSLTPGPLGSNNFNATVDVSAGGSVAYQISGTVDPSATGVISNTAMVTPPAGATETNPGNESATDSDTVITKEADLSITKTGPATATAGGMLTYTVTVTNNGPSDASNVVVTDNLPVPSAGGFLTFRPAPDSSVECIEGGGVITCSLAGLPAAAGSNTKDFTLAFDVSADAMGTIDNSASVAADEPDPVAGNNAAPAPQVTIAKEADLRIEKTDSPASVVAGQDSITYTITVTNDGPSDATNVTVSDTIPASLSLVSATPSQGGPCVGDPAVSCPLGTIASGSNATVTIVANVAASAAGIITNTATVSSDVTDPDTNDNMVMEGTTVNIEADISVSKTGPANFAIGGSDNYVVTISNTTGPSDATAQLVDTLPPGFTFNAGMSTTPTTCAQVLQVVTCDAVTVAFGGMAAVYTLNVTVNSGTPNTMVTNTAVANLTVGTDSNLANNTSPFMSLLVNTAPVIGTPMAAVETVGNTRLAATGTPPPPPLTAADEPIEPGEASSAPDDAKGPKPIAAAADSPTPVASNSGVPALTLASDLETLGMVTDAEMDALTFSVSASNTSAGTFLITNSSNGAFTYDPPAGCTGTDTLKYDVTDGFTSVPGEVTVSFVGCIWYVDNSHTPDGVGTNNGTAFDPFNKLSDGADGGVVDDGEDASGNNQDIFVFTGSGTTGQDAGITLNNAQRLIGNGVALTFPGTVNSIAGPHTLFAAGTHPLIDNIGGSNDVDVTSAAAALTGIEIRGLHFVGSIHGINVSISGSGSAEVAIANNIIGTTGGSAVGPTMNGLNAVSTSTGNLELAFNNNTVNTVGSAGAFIDGSASIGAIFITSFVGNTFNGLNAPEGIAGTGVMVNTATFDAVPSTVNDFDAVPAGGNAIGSSGVPVGAAGMVLATVAGNVNFGSPSGDLDIFATTTGLMASGTGAFTMGTPDTGFLITVPDGSVINSSFGVAIDLDPLTAIFGTSGGSQVTLSGQSASFDEVAGMLFFSSTSALTGGAGDVYSQTNSTADITYAGTVVDDSGTGITLATNGAGGSASFTSTVDLGTTTPLTNAALEMTGNNVTFAANFANLDIETSGATGIFGTTNGMLDIDTGTVMTTGAPAVDITGIDFGTTVDLTSISSINPGGAAVGIDLDGVSGNFNVTGTTTVDGTAAAMVGTGIRIANSSATATFANVDIGIGGTPGTVANGVSLSSNTGISTFTAARQADVGESSLRRWLREDENFRLKLRGLRDEALSHAALQLQHGASEAAGVMRQVVKGDKKIEPARASLIRAAVDFGFRSHVYDDVIDRLKTVENEQSEAKKR